MSKIKLANRSSKNRMFYDNLIKEIAICLHCGDRILNRELQLPSYRGTNTRLKDKEAISLTKNEAMGFDTPRDMLPVATLDQIDRMLSEAPCRLMRCKSREPITEYIKQRTDLTDCHLTALNELQRFNQHNPFSQ